MPADRQALGARLRAAREADPYWSREQLARLMRAAADPGELESGTIAHVTSLARRIKAWERGEAVPAPKYRRLYARVLGAAEEDLFGAPPSQRPSLWRLEESGGRFTPEDEERLVLAVRQPSRVDSRVVESLATILAAQRRTEDAIGSAPLVGPVRAQLATIEALVAGAGGTVRRQVVDVAAQWAQFAGWLHIAVGDLGGARSWLDRASEWAIETGDLAMVGSITSWKAYLAEHAGQIGPLIGMAQAARRHRSGPGRAYDLHMEARGHALAGDLAAAARLLEGAGEAVATARPEEAHPWEYYYFAPGFFDLERGVVLGHMGRLDPARNREAIEHLAAGRAALPADMRGSEWGGIYLCHQAAAHVQDGDAAAAVAVAAQALEIARVTFSESLPTRLRSLHARMAERWPDRPDVTELGEAVR